MNGINRSIGLKPRKDNRCSFRYYPAMRATAFHLGLLLAAGIAAGAQDLTISAAASLTDVLLQIQYPAQRFVGARIFLNLGGSGTLRRQIEQGAPADVFFSAAREDMDKLQQQGLIVPGTRRDILSNSLVVIAEPSTKVAAGPDDLKRLVSGAAVVAIGNPDSVAAGRCAVEALKKYGLYELAKSKMALGGSVREVLTYVQSGSAPLGFVFLTDALSAEPAGSIVRIFRFPAETFSAPIVYPVAVTSSSRNRALAEKLIQFLAGSEARNAFVKAGFEVP